MMIPDNCALDNNMLRTRVNSLQYVHDTDTICGRKMGDDEQFCMLPAADTGCRLITHNTRRLSERKQSTFCKLCTWYLKVTTEESEIAVDPVNDAYYSMNANDCFPDIDLTFEMYNRDTLGNCSTDEERIGIFLLVKKEWRNDS